MSQPKNLLSLTNSIRISHVLFQPNTPTIAKVVWFEDENNPVVSDDNLRAILYGVDHGLVEETETLTSRNSNGTVSLLGFRLTSKGITLCESLEQIDLYDYVPEDISKELTVMQHEIHMKNAEAKQAMLSEARLAT